MSKAFWQNGWRRGIVQRGLVVLLAVMALTLLLIQQFWVGRAQAQGPQREPVVLDAVGYTQVQQLRREVGLTSRDLASMGLTQSQAETTLIDLAEWYLANQTQLAANDQAQRQASRQLRQTYRAIHVGPRDEGVIQQVASLQAAVQSVKQQREQLLQGLTATTDAHLTSDQKHLRSMARTKATENASSSLARGQQAVRVLSSAQRDALALHRQQHMPGVLAAEDAVLPVPEELKSFEDVSGAEESLQ